MCFMLCNVRLFMLTYHLQMFEKYCKIYLRILRIHKNYPQANFNLNSYIEMKQEQRIQQKQNVDQNHQCSICLDVFYKPVQLMTCKHFFCSNCLNEAAIINNNRRCPLCRSPFQQNQLKEELELWQSMQKKYPISVRLKAKLIQERVIVKLLIGNQTKEVPTTGDNKYNWKLFIKQAEGGEQLHKMIDSVEIELHQTFNPRKIKFQVKDKNPITLERTGWGTFRINIKVYWKNKYNQKYSDFYHDLQFEPLSERIAQTYLTLKN